MVGPPPTSSTLQRPERPSPGQPGPGRPGPHRLRDHWQWRPDWAVDRACLLWYLTFEDVPTLAPHVERAQARLRGTDCLDVVPLRWLHLTLDDVGFVDELAPGQAEEAVRVARAAVSGWVPPRLTLGPLVAMEDSVVLGAGPVAELTGLRDRLRTATASLGEPFATSRLDGFWPHVTVAYLNRDCDPAQVLAPAQPEGGTAGEPVLVMPRLTLAAVTRRDRHYQWTACAQLPLGR